MAVLVALAVDVAGVMVSISDTGACRLDFGYGANCGAVFDLRNVSRTMTKKSFWVALTPFLKNAALPALRQASMAVASDPANLRSSILDFLTLRPSWLRSLRNFIPKDCSISLDDVLQEAFIRMQRTGKVFETKDEMFAYVKTIARHFLSDLAKSPRSSTSQIGQMVDADGKAFELPGSITADQSMLKSMLFDAGRTVRAVMPHSYRWAPQQRRALLLFELLNTHDPVADGKARRRQVSRLLKMTRKSVRVVDRWVDDYTDRQNRSNAAM